MLSRIEVMSSANPAVRFFILQGLTSLTEKQEFIVSDPDSNDSRALAVKQAQDAKIPLVAALLRLRYFRQISCMPYRGSDCIALFLKDGESWDRALGAKDATMEKIILGNITKYLEGVSRLQGKDEPQADELNKITDFVRAHPLQRVVEKDKGTLGVKSLDDGNLILIFGGACSSSTTCVGNQISSRNWISRDVSIKFPDAVKNVTFAEALTP